MRQGCGIQRRKQFASSGAGFRRGFTIVELIIVIIVIAILATIATVGYGAVQRNTRQSTVKSDLKNAAAQLEADRQRTGSYPANPALSNGSKGIALSQGNSVPSYTAVGATWYCIQISSSYSGVTTMYITSESQTPTEGSCPSAPTTTSSDTTAACFSFDAGQGMITQYYQYQNNNSSSGNCPKTVAIPEKINSITVKAIGASAFQNQSITSVTLPTTLQTIGNAAFNYNLIVSITIPPSVTYIAPGAFSDNGISNLTVSSPVLTIDSYAFAGNNLSSVLLPTSVVLMVSAFDGSTTITRY